MAFWEKTGEIPPDGVTELAEGFYPQQQEDQTSGKVISLIWTLENQQIQSHAEMFL